MRRRIPIPRLPRACAPALVLGCAALVVGCAPATSGDAAGDAGGPAAEAPSDRIELPPSVRRNLGITFVEVEARRVAETLRVPGAFELHPLARHEYRMSLPGRVELLVDQYQPVEPGTPLFRFQSPAWPELVHEVLVGEQAIGTARAEIDVARETLTETRARIDLIRERLAALARAEFRAAELETEAAQLEASLPRLEAQLRLAETGLANARGTREHALQRAATAAGIPRAGLLRPVPRDGREVPAYETIDWIEVTAAERGVVEALAVTDGAFVEPPEVVLSTVDPARLRFRALALQADLPRLAGAVEARIVPPQGAGVPLDAAVPATPTIGLEAHPAERTLTLLAAPTGPLRPWMRPGVSAFLEVVVASSNGPALAVPRAAVVRDGLQHVFFRRDPGDPNRVIRVEADLGVDDGRWVVLESGVMRGDEVVLEGAYELRLASEQARGADASGHFHADGSFHGEDDH